AVASSGARSLQPALERPPGFLGFHEGQGVVADGQGPIDGLAAPEPRRLVGPVAIRRERRVDRRHPEEQELVDVDAEPLEAWWVQQLLDQGVSLRPGPA